MKENTVDNGKLLKLPNLRLEYSTGSQYAWAKMYKDLPCDIRLHA